jgi:hypothetical protein
MKMKRLFSVLMVCFILGLAGAGTTSAALIDLGDGTILDDQANLLWYQNLDYFDYQTYDEQITAIAQLGDGWRMANESDITLLLTYTYAEIAGKFLPTDISNPPVELYYGRYEKAYSDAIHYWLNFWWNPDNGFSGGSTTGVVYNSISDNVTGAWVVKDYNPVPIPGAVWLLGSGLVGLAGLRRKFRNRS